MSWSLMKTGRAGDLAKKLPDIFAECGGCPAGSSEEQAKDKLGEIAGALCESMHPDAIVRVAGSGSAWVEHGGKVRSHDVKFSFETILLDD